MTICDIVTLGRIDSCLSWDVPIRFICDIVTLGRIDSDSDTAIYISPKAKNVSSKIFFKRQDI